ncbi:MAG TPA: fused MFS/spermidine synthase [Chloroflexota bacterium]|nr:fused MFS/spermidine synthase [Chloroflexota bacterium]
MSTSQATTTPHPVSAPPSPADVNPNHGLRRWEAGGLFLPALLILFTASGASGLIYEVVWLRFLTLVFGVTIYAVATVLTAFMGGLALGGLLASRLVDRLQRPLRAYGLIELGIALSAVLTPAAFDLLRQLYRAVYPVLPHDLTSLSLIRFVLTGAILLLPTTLMGMTLPIVVRSSLMRRSTLGTSLSLLYACNTAGGIAGAYLAAFVLIGTIGVQATTLTAALLNAAVGVVAIILDSLIASTALGRPEAEPPNGSPPLAGKGARQAASLGGEGEKRAAEGWLLAAFALSGAASLAYQVIWTRILATFFEATTYAFNLILCTFLLGLACGSYLITPLINRRANWLLVAAVLEWAIAVAALLSMTAISRLPHLVTALRGLPVLEHLVSGEQRATALMAFVTMFPSTLLLGAAFPIVMKLYAGGEGGSGLGRRLGRAYATNVCGAIAGSWAAGFLLIPLLGTQTSLVLLALASVVVAGGLLRAATPRRFAVLAPIGALLALGAAIPTPNVYTAVFSHFGDPVLWYREGLEQTVTILQGPQERRMFLNGWHQANDTPGMVQFHSQLGELPMLLQPAPPAAEGAPAERSVLVIGLGGGATAGAAAAHAGARLEVVELSGSVVEGARFFDHVNGGVVGAPNVSIRTDDGRNYLLLTDRRFDVIMADVIRPQHAGSAALYSLEYYRLARSALKEHGVMIQWIDQRLPEAHYKMLLRTFLQAFPYATAWADGGFVIGSHRPYTLDRQVLAARLASRAPGAAARSGLDSPEAVLRLFTAGDAELRAYAGPGPIITDDHPYIEFFRSLPHDPAPPDLSQLRRHASSLPVTP